MSKADSDISPSRFAQSILSVLVVFLTYALIRWLVFLGAHPGPDVLREIFIDQTLLLLCFLTLLAIIHFKLTGEPIERITHKISVFSPLVLTIVIVNAADVYTGDYYRNVFGEMDTGLYVTLFIGYYLFLNSLILAAAGPARVLAGFFIYPATVLLTFTVPSFLGEYTVPLLNHLYAVLLTLILGSFWYFLYNKAGFISFIRNFRWLRIIHYSFMMTFGVVIFFYTGSTRFQFSLPAVAELVPAYLAVLFSWLFVVNVNDKYDLNADRLLGLDRPLVTGNVPQTHYEIVSGIYFISALYFASLINLPFFLITLTMIGMAYCYSAPPFRLKRYPFIATFVLATVNLMITFLGYLVFSPEGDLSGYPIKIMLMIWTVFTLSNNSKDIRDYEGDKADGVITLPTLLGLKWSKIVIGLLMLLSYFLAPLFLGIGSLYPFALAFGLGTFWLINRKTVKDSHFYLCYFAYFLIVINAMVFRIS